MILYVDLEDFDGFSYSIKTLNGWEVGELLVNEEAFSIIIYDFIVEDAYEKYPKYPEH